jgi:hypothetical protein
MEVIYERTGGFAGMRMTASFDLDELTEQDAASIQELLHDARFHELPEQIVGPAGIPDQFTYRITVTEETFQHTVTTGDASAPPELRPLIDLLSRMARMRGTG